MTDARRRNPPARACPPGGLAAGACVSVQAARGLCSKACESECTPRGNVGTRLAPRTLICDACKFGLHVTANSRGLFALFGPRSCHVPGPPTQATPEPLPSVAHIADPKWRGFAPNPPHSARRPVPHHAPPPRVLNSPSNAFESVVRRAVDCDQRPSDAAALRVACRACVRPRAGRNSQARSLLSHTALTPCQLDAASPRIIGNSA